MQLTLGFVRSGSQILIKDVDCLQNQVSTRIIDATDLPDQNLQGLFVGQNDHFEQLETRGAEKLLASQVGGFYDPGTDTFYLMERFTGGIAIFSGFGTLNNSTVSGNSALPIRTPSRPTDRTPAAGPTGCRN